MDNISDVSLSIITAHLSVALNHESRAQSRCLLTSFMPALPLENDNFSWDPPESRTEPKLKRKCIRKPPFLLLTINKVYSLVTAFLVIKSLKLLKSWTLIYGK